MAHSAEMQSQLDQQHDDSASDKEMDNFEDAVDSASVRSLTGRKSSPVKDVRPTSSDSEVKSARLSRPNSIATATAESTKEDGSQEHGAKENSAQENGAREKGAKEDGDKENGVEEHHQEEAVSVNIAQGESGQANGTGTLSPPASTRSSSQGSLHEVKLDDIKPEEEDVPTAMEAQKELAPAAPLKSMSEKLSLSNITNSLSSMPWSPSNSESSVKASPVTVATGSLPQAPTAPAQTTPSVTRKLTGPFSWLTRASTPKEQTPSAKARRDTGSSEVTVISNPEMMSKLDEDGAMSGRPKRSSLRDRFKVVRMREEAGISLPNEHDGSSKNTGSPKTRSSTLSVVSPSAEDPASPSANNSLAPGTASGTSTGPPAKDSNVDWDLWQTVVYEGPAAVARTSAEELNKAIATGIPNVIRGVVWQVLAESKNDDLEAVYRELAARGTDKAKDRHSSATSVSISSNGNLSMDKEGLASAASSIHSEQSATVYGRKTPPTPPEQDSEAILKAHALGQAARKKMEKEDYAMIQKLEKTIRRDLGARTSFSKHAASAGLQDGLLGVCKAYALYDDGVGYAQGMNFLVMPILFNMPEEEAFCLLVRLMNQYKLRDLFIQDMPGLHMRLYQFERLLEDFEPALYCHLHRRGITSHLYATQWFLTLFAYRFPLQLVLRIYDLIFSEGLSAILKFGIVLMQKNAQTLLGMSDMAQLTTFLKDKVFDVYIDQSPTAGSILENGFFGSSSANIDKEVYRADELVRDACEVKVTPELLKAYTAEWEEKTEVEKAREQELESLKQSNLSQSIKVRKLEARLEAADREQTAMANELVHTRVENEELKDENESLKGQVHELRVVIDKQPEEIETSWKLERDSLMRRNQNVHEENLRLEKEMADLEEQLVKTKMRYAEINDQHETLTRKWTDLRRQFS